LTYLTNLTLGFDTGYRVRISHSLLTACRQLPPAAAEGGGETAVLLARRLRGGSWRHAKRHGKASRKAAPAMRHGKGVTESVTENTLTNLGEGVHTRSSLQQLYHHRQMTLKRRRLEN